MPQPHVQPGAVYQAVDHGRRFRVRVVSRSEKYPGKWVCEDLERGETAYLTAEQLKTTQGNSR